MWQVGVRAIQAALLGAFIGMAPALAGAPIEGVWRSASGTEITIVPCPEGWCGLISRIVIPDHIVASTQGVDVMAPEDLFDARNKNPSLRSRPILGLQILSLKGTGRPAVFDGTIYNPEDGETYSVFIEVVGPRQVGLTGCMLVVLCRGEEWARVN